MRAALLLVPLIVLVGCGSGAHDEAAGLAQSSAMVDSPSFAGEAPAARTASAAKAADLASGFRQQRQGKDGAHETAASASSAKLTSLETPVSVPRMVVRHAQLALRVVSVEDAERKVATAAQSLGGSVEASQGGDLSGPTPTMSVTLRVPQSRFEETLRQLESFGTRLSKSISSEDVTAQAVDMDARVKSLRVQEDAYRAILAGARRIPDILEIQEKLTDVRTQIEEIVAQRRGIGDQAARSTIEVTLSQIAAPVKAAPPSPRPNEPGWLATTWSDATGSLLSVVRFVVSCAVWVFVMLPILVPVALVSRYAYRRAQKAVV